MPVEPKKKAELFLSSNKFKEMISCIASEIFKAAKSKNLNQVSWMNKSIKLYVATDSAEIREVFATRLIAATLNQLNGAGLSKWEIEIDYFSGIIPPAHFMTWTHNMQHMTQV